MPQITYEIGGLFTELNPIQRAWCQAPKETNFSHDKKSRLVSNLSSEKTVEGRRKVRPNGTNIGALLYWGFFSVISLSLLPTLISNTRFADIERMIVAETKKENDYYQKLDIKKLKLSVEQIIKSNDSSDDLRQLSKSEIVTLNELTQAVENIYSFQNTRQEDVNTIIVNLRVGSNVMLGLALVTILIGSGIAAKLGRKLAGQINRISKMMYMLADGDNDVSVVPEDKVGIEVAQMYDALGVFKDQFTEIKDLRQKEEIKSRKALEQSERLKDTALKIDGQVAKIFEGVQQDQVNMLDLSGTVEKLSTKLKGTVDVTSNAIKSAVTSTEGVGHATTDLSNQIKVILKGARSSLDLSKLAVANAQQSNERVRSLGELSNKIGEVVGLIRNIAQTTNLLALNATIEATRAGDAGLGFAVVAREVKSLSNQTSKATEEISAQVDGICKEVELTIATIHQISETIDKLSHFSNDISSQILAQADVTNRIISLVASVTSDIYITRDAITGLSSEAKQNQEVSENIKEATQQIITRIENMGQEIKTSLRQLEIEPQ